MTEQDGQTVDFGSRESAEEATAAESRGGSVDRAGYMEAPSQIAEAAAEQAEGSAQAVIRRIVVD